MVAESPQPNASTRLRVLVLVLAGLETAAMLLLLVLVIGSGQLTSGEALSRSLGWALLAIYGLPYLVCVVPALALALLDRWLPFALALCILVVPAVLVVLNYA